MASTAEAQGIQVSTQPTLQPAFDPAVTDYVTRCTAGTPVQVTVSAQAGTTADVDGHGPLSGDFTDQVSLKEGQAFTIVETSGSTTATYDIRCLPADFPAWTFQRSGTPQAQWYFVAPFAKTNFQPLPPGVSGLYGALFDGNGVPVWWYKASQPSLDFKALPNGNFAYAHFNASGDEERRLDGSLVRTLNAGGDAQNTDSHEIQLLPNGNYLVASERAVQNQTVCGQPNSPVSDNGFQELAPDGSVVFSWWAIDHIPFDEIPSAWCGFVLGNPAGGLLDTYHINSVERDGNDYLVSFRHLNAVYKISGTDGSIIWKLGGNPRAGSLTVLSDPLSADPLRGQHDARVLSDGTVTVHDNGYQPTGGRPPRAVRYAIDEGAQTATLVEQKNDPGSLSAALCCGSARKLPGGDWVMSWGSDGLVTELSPMGNRVFSLTFDDGLFSYRAQPVLFGALSAADLHNGMNAQFPRGFTRVRSAPQVKVPLVPAFKQCQSPDLTHGEPLAAGSCSSPAQTSDFLTIGTPDSNGLQAQSSGFVAYKIRIGDPTTPANEADVSLNVTLTDVRSKSDLTDYTGQLQLRGAVRITDRLNGSLQNQAATGFDTEFPVTVPCSATVSTAVGGSCSLNSSVNAIVPGAVVEGKRASWELGQIQVFDGGESGVAGGSGATLFETQGLFVP